MQIEWTGRGIEISDRLRARVAGGLDKIGRHLPGHAGAHVVLGIEGPTQGTPRQRAEIVVHHRLGTFTAKAESHDMQESVNQVLDKLDKQVRRAKRKLTEGRRRAERPDEGVIAMLGGDGGEQVGGDTELELD